MILASFNVENMFRRPVVLNGSATLGQRLPALDQATELQTLFDRPQSTASARTRKQSWLACSGWGYWPALAWHSPDRDTSDRTTEVNLVADLPLNVFANWDVFRSQIRTTAGEVPAERVADVFNVMSAVASGPLGAAIGAVDGPYVNVGVLVSRSGRLRFRRRLADTDKKLRSAERSFVGEPIGSISLVWVTRLDGSLSNFGATLSPDDPSVAWRSHILTDEGALHHAGFGTAMGEAARLVVEGMHATHWGWGEFGTYEPNAYFARMSDRLWTPDSNALWGGYSWLTVMPAPVVERPGGVDRIRASPADQVQTVSTPAGVVVIAVLRNDPHAADDQVLRAWKTFLEPALPPPPLERSFQRTRDIDPWYVVPPMMLPEDWTPVVQTE